MKNEQGFTLIELLLYAGIFTILLTVLFGIFTSIIDVQLQSQATSSVSEDGSFLLARLAYDIQRSQTIVSPGALGSQTNSLQLTADGTTYTYSSTSGTLTLTNGTTNTTDAVTSNDTTISNIMFTRLGNNVPGGKDTIQIVFTLVSKSTTRSVAQTQTFQTGVGLR